MGEKEKRLQSTLNGERMREDERGTSQMRLLLVLGTAKESGVSVRHC